MFRCIVSKHFYYFAEDRWVFNMIKYLGQKWAGEVFPLTAPLCSAWPEIITPKGRKYLINRSILFLILTIQWLCLFYFRWSNLYCTVEFSSQTNITGVYCRGGFGIRYHAGVIFWELKNVFKEPLIKYFSKKLQNEATHAILETVSGSNFYMK